MSAEQLKLLEPPSNNELPGDTSLVFVRIIDDGVEGRMMEFDVHEISIACVVMPTTYVVGIATMLFELALLPGAECIPNLDCVWLTAAII